MKGLGVRFIQKTGSGARHPSVFSVVYVMSYTQWDHTSFAVTIMVMMMMMMMMVFLMKLAFLFSQNAYKGRLGI